MKDLKSDELKILLEEKGFDSYTESDVIEAKNNLTGFFEILVEIAKENPDLINDQFQKSYKH